MADLESRREARRRKILQSTEDRMKRVMGRHQDSNTESETPLLNTEEDSSEAPIKEDLNPSPSLRQRKPVNDGTNTTSEIVPTSNVTAKSTVKISPIKRPQTLKSQTDMNDSINTSKSSSEAKMMLKHFEFLRIVLCFMTAFLCRKVLVSGYGIFYVQSVMLPFMCLEAGFFMFKKKMLHNVILPHRSSMLIGVLMLCGIKPNVLQLYNKLMGYMTAASEDFAMFFFAFMFANVFVS